ncbi:unnamed protein product [Withania somnifera]
MTIKLMRVIDITTIAVVVISLLSPITLAIEGEEDNFDNYFNPDYPYDSSSVSDNDDNYKGSLAPKLYYPVTGDDDDDDDKVEECLQNISDDCGVIIFNWIMDSGKHGDVEKECCNQLLTLGIKCHNAIMESTLDNMKGVNKTLIWKNSDKLWNECASINFIYK